MWNILVTNYLITKLQEKLNPIHGIINNLSVAHTPTILDAKESFNKYSNMIKVTYFHPKKLGINDVWVAHEVLSTTSIDIQQSMFTLVMKSNVSDVMVKPLDANRLMGL